MKVMIETATGRRTPSGVMTSGDAGLGAGRHVDIVVADAEARHHGEASVGMDALAREARHQQDQRVEVGDLVGAHRIGGIDVGDLDARRLAQRLHVEIREGRRAVRLLEIARQRDAELVGHGCHRFLQPARSSATASVSAFCSTQTSPE